MIKFNEAQAIRKTYDQIVKRLKDERVNFGARARGSAEEYGRRCGGRVASLVSIDVQVDHAFTNFDRAGRALPPPTAFFCCASRLRIFAHPWAQVDALSPNDNPHADALSMPAPKHLGRASTARQLGS
eukprot:2118893-Pleurochrysis_carterae.AAC.1